MSNEKNTTEIKKTNFIQNIIEKDLLANNSLQIQTRFPPEPNGYLHIGHAKSICLNFETAEKYNGKCNLRFDDTNPSKESEEYVDSIKKDISWLGYSWNEKENYTSNYFDEFYSYAINLINQGLAYVCFLDAEKTREYRGTLTEAGTNSPHRESSSQENIELFSKMKDGDFKEGECVLRAKIDMKSSFMCMRDPTLYRIRFVSHHQTKDKWCIYPMYDFAHPISDFIENITHSLCTLEFQDNRRLYDWVLDKISNGKNSPHQYEFSRLNLEYTILSKRILSELVENKIVAGWNDPRMPTIAGMSNRGYTPESIKKFIRGIGVSKTDSIIPMTLLEDNVREELNQYSPRTMAVLDPIEIVITNYEDSKKEILKAPLHPQNEEMGSREITFSNSIYIEKEDFRMEANKKYKRLVLNKEVRLRNSYVIKAESVETDENGEVVKIYCTYDKDTLGKNPEDRKVKGVIHWVNAKTAIKAKINLYDRLFSVANVAKSIKEKNILESINPNSLVVKTAFVEENMLENKSKLAYQFERIGYFYRNPNSENELEFNRTVSLRDTWSD